MAKKITIGINGFGRIGRAVFKIALPDKRLAVVGINDLTDTKILAHLLQHDSVYGPFAGTVKAEANALVINGKRVPVFGQPEPAKIPWSKVGADVVVESTGFFTEGNAAAAHLKGGAKRVIVSAPTKGEEVKTFVRGVNTKNYNDEKIISNASCTTNCVSPVLVVMLANFGIAKALMTTAHAYTSSQNLIDGPPPARKKDVLDGRAAALNIVPSSTGAATAVIKTIPELKNKFGAMSLRVPVAVGSISDFSIVTTKPTTVEKVNMAFRKAAKNPIYQGVLSVTDDPLASSDIIGSPYSAIVDLSYTQVVDGDLVKVMAWYDNEWGYATQLVKQIAELF